MNGGDKNNGEQHHILEAIQEEILCRVSSVQDLLKFRSVCKSWKTIIDRDDFKKNHFEMAKLQNTNASSILIFKRTAGNLNEFETTLYYCRPLYWSNTVIVKNIQQPFNLGMFLEDAAARELIKCLPCKVNDVYNDLVLKRFGAVNGVVCLSWDDVVYVIWNPSTKQFRTFKGPPIPVENCKANKTHNLTFTAFGFDPLSQDYKFLYGIFMPSNIPNYTIVVYNLYSHRNNSWFHRNDIYLPLTVSGIVNGDGYTDDGNFYWFAKHCERNLTPGLISFNFCTETFRWWIFPQEFHTIHQAIVVGNNGDLNLLATFTNGAQEGNLRCEIWWIFCERGSISGRRKYTAELQREIGRPVGLINGGNMMMFEASLLEDNRETNNKTLVLINPLTQSCVIPRFTAREILVFNFVNSLFSFNL